MSPTPAKGFITLFNPSLITGDILLSPLLIKPSSLIGLLLSSNISLPAPSSL